MKYFEKSRTVAAKLVCRYNIFMEEKPEEKIFIKKADGTSEPFLSSKLEQSLMRAGASEPVIQEIIEKVTTKLVEGMTTKEIYQDAFSLLRDREKELVVAARYSLKKAVFDLGPSGFPFEDFIREIYRAMGYTASTGIVLKGKCAEHEVDLFARKEGKKHGAEIKFHNHQGIKTDLKVALYVYARFEDLIKSGEVDEGVLITNTKFTKNARAYGTCVGLTMISWDYPKEGNGQENLYSLIETSGLHPITCLTTLPKSAKKRLLENNIVLCRTIKEDTSMLESYGISNDQIPLILEEINTLCQPGTGV